MPWIMVIIMDYGWLWCYMVLMLIVSVDFGLMAHYIPPVCRTSPHRGNHREVWPPIRCRGATAYSRWMTLLDGLLDGLKVSCAWEKTQLFTRWKGPPFSESLGPGGPPSVTLPAASVVGAKGIERLKRHMEICLSSEGGKVTWHWWKIGQPPPLLVLDSIFDLYLYIYLSLYIYMSIYSFFWEWMVHKKQQQFLSTEPSELFPQKKHQPTDAGAWKRYLRSSWVPSLSCLGRMKGRRNFARWVVPVSMTFGLRTQQEAQRISASLAWMDYMSWGAQTLSANEYSTWWFAYEGDNQL